MVFFYVVLEIHRTIKKVLEKRWAVEGCPQGNEVI